jgi:hypothetical protein
MARVNQLITVGSTPVQLSANSLLVTEVLIQMQHGGTGIGYVMDGIPILFGAPSPTNAGQLTAELAPATSTAPGGAFANQDLMDIQRTWVHGSNTGDKIIVTYNTAL